MPKITSRENAKLKLARKAREGREKDSIFVEGLRLAEEVLRSGITVKEIFLTEDFGDNERAARLVEALESRNHSINEVAGKLFASIADTKTSQGVILICEKPATDRRRFEARFVAADHRLPVVIFLNEINNPSNLGAILRTAEAVDAAGVVISKNSADVFSPKSVRASMGAAFRLNIWTNADFETVLNWAGEKKFVSTAADVNAEKSYSEIDWRRSRLLIFGSEAHGLTPEEFGEIEETLIIPMENGVESLNLAVSCGIVLFEAKRQMEKRRESSR
ncbi:MAG TPA: RNA methyltransferase [Pyrinomonadaceae bacterium]|jgi:TrmH family RNA methyltransferase